MNIETQQNVDPAGPPRHPPGRPMRRTRRCGHCRQTGHDRRNCPVLLTESSQNTITNTINNETIVNDPSISSISQITSVQSEQTTSDNTTEDIQLNYLK